MVRLVEHLGGGIFALFNILKDHWGAVGRDLAAAHWTWDEACADMPFHQLVEFVVFSPPGTATFYVINEGWDPNTHRLTDILDVSALAMWLGTTDAQEKFPKHRPERSPRPGGQSEMPAPEPHMSVEDYIALSGM
jgi:hypothetical protein